LFFAISSNIFSIPFRISILGTIFNFFISLFEILTINEVSVGVRRRDYIEIGVACDTKYYNKAIHIIVTKIDNPTYYIFSDDIEWCKKNILITEKHFFVEQNKDLSFENMQLMSLCNIILFLTLHMTGGGRIKYI
jgi:hypothetical protein